MFCDPENSACEKAETEFAEAAKELKGGKVIFSTSHPKDASGHFKKLAEFISADIKNLPSLILFDAKDSGKFKYPYEVTKDNLIKFVKEFNDGKLTRFLKSAEP